MPRATGFPGSDAQDDFLRARRRQVLSRLTHRLRGEPSDFDVMLPLDEVLDALGRAGQRSLGLQTIPLGSIVGTVDRSKEFDRSFRPTSSKVRGRWERIATAQRRGEAIPPISVYRIGSLHFVRDGHHRVSVAQAQKRDEIDAYVTEITTKLDPDTGIRPADLPLKSHERLFRERVPLPPARARRIVLTDPWQYGSLAEGVEAWGFRAMQEREEFMTRGQVAKEWFEHEYEPVVEMLAEAGLIEDGTEADCYIRVAAERYRLLRTHEWSDEVLERLRAKRP